MNAVNLRAPYSLIPNKLTAFKGRLVDFGGIDAASCQVYCYSWFAFPWCLTQLKCSHTLEGHFIPIAAALPCSAETFHAMTQDVTGRLWSFFTSALEDWWIQPWLFTLTQCVSSYFRPKQPQRLGWCPISLHSRSNWESPPNKRENKNYMNRSAWIKTSVWRRRKCLPQEDHSR